MRVRFFHPACFPPTHPAYCRAGPAGSSQAGDEAVKVPENVPALSTEFSTILLSVQHVPWRSLLVSQNGESTSVTHVYMSAQISHVHHVCWSWRECDGQHTFLPCLRSQAHGNTAKAGMEDGALNVSKAGFPFSLPVLNSPVTGSPFPAKACLCQVYGQRSRRAGPPLGNDSVTLSQFPLLNSLIR